MRRKHNYLPLIVEILKVLGQEGKLVALVEKVGRAIKQIKYFPRMLNQNQIMQSKMVFFSHQQSCDVKWGGGGGGG